MFHEIFLLVIRFPLAYTQNYTFNSVSKANGQKEVAKEKAFTSSTPNINLASISINFL